MSSISVLVGSSDFEKRIEENAFFVDKTLFIKDIIFGPEISVILRPRRFGKSTNLFMLESFLSVYSELTSFSDLIIGEDLDFCNRHFKQYPVIHVSFKDCEASTWEIMNLNVWNILRNVVLSHLDHGELNIKIPESTNLNSETPPEFFYDILLELITALFKKHKKRVVVLIDEYDAPLNDAFRNGYYEKASLFFKQLYSSALKDNKAVMRGCLMGNTEVRGGSIFSGLNNFSIFSVASSKYSE
jgi:hypothetical protein